MELKRLILRVSWNGLFGDYKALLESKAFKNAPDDAPIFISDCITVCVPLRHLQGINNEIILELEHYNEPC